VGIGAVIIDSSICVDTIPGRAILRHLRMNLLLDMRELTQRDLHAEMAARTRIPCETRFDPRPWWAPARVS
jgi:hypothetical protein